MTAVNPQAGDAREAEIILRGASVRSGRARILASGDIHDHNSFDHPRTVEPKETDLPAQGRSFVYKFAPASVTRLTLTLA